MKQWPATLDKVLALPFDSVIPGTDRGQRALERFRDFMTSLWGRPRRSRERGGSLDNAVQLVASTSSALALWYAPTLNRGFVIRRTWEKGSERRGGPMSDRKVAFLTGASRGIGRCALELARRASTSC